LKNLQMGGKIEIWSDELEIGATFWEELEIG
jgi:hypothetical protein